MNKLVLALLFLFSAKAAFSQNKTPLLEKKVSIEANAVSSQALLQMISVQTGIVFSYNPDILKEIRPISLTAGNKSVRSILRQSFGESIQLSERGKYVILKKEKSPSKKRFVEGYVSEPLTGRNIGQATVYDKNSYASAITNQYGYFKIEVPENDTLNNVLMVSKNGQSDTVKVLSNEKAQFVEAEFRPIPKDTVKKDSITSITKASDEQLIPQWMISKDVFVNTFNLSDTFFQQINFSVLPYVSTNRLLTGNSVNNIALNLTIGYCQEIRVAEAGLILNIVRDNVRSFQVAGVGNIVGGKVVGYQGAGVFNIAQSVIGFQQASVLNLCQNVKGAQISSIYNRSISVNGLQVTGFYNKATYVEGAQLASIVNKADSINGFQLGGIVNIANKMKGIQVAGYINIANEVDSFQLAGFMNQAHGNAKVQAAGFMNQCSATNHYQFAGFMNQSRVSECIQIAGFMNQTNVSGRIQVAGFMNIAKNAEGRQIGFMNISDTCALPIGFISIVKKGVHNLELSVNESLFASLAFRTGVKKFYNIFEAGTNLTNNEPRMWFVGYGLGRSWQLAGRKSIFAETGYKFVVQQNSFANNLGIYKISTGLNYSLTRNISLSGALSLNFAVANTNNNIKQEILKDVAPFVLNKASRDESHQISTWVGASIGLRFF